MSYRNLEIWQLSWELVIDIHKMTLTPLPKNNKTLTISKNPEASTKRQEASSK